ncbi:MAG: sensor histidine kinase [Monoglobaceae bacterium]
MKIKLKNNSMRKRIFQLTVLQIFVPILFLGIISMSISVSIIKKQMEKYMGTVADSVEDRLEECSDSIFLASQEIVYDNEVFKCLTSNDPEFNPESEYLFNMIQRILLSRNEIDAICLFINDVEVKGAKCEITLPEKNSVAYNEITKLAKGQKGKMFWYADKIGDDVKNIFIVRTLYNPYTDKEKGVVMFQMRKDIFNETVGKIDIDNYNFAIFSSKGEVIYSGSDNITSEDLPPEGKMTSRGRMTICKMIDDIGWYIVGYVNLNWLYKDIYFLIECMLLLCLISTVLLIMFSIYIQRKYVDPINNLIEIMNGWNEDGAIENIYKDRSDEIGELYKEFCGISERIINLININYRDKIIKNEIELKMLQSQINPHFLFNTLESISCVARINDIPEISRMVIALSDIMQKSMGKGERLTTFGKELEHADNYLYIIKVRFGDKISVRKHIAEDTLDVIVPTLILQPILENAVQHGIMPMDGEGHIDIRSELKDGSLVIEIEDDGVGINAEQMSLINKNLNISNEEYLKNTAHIGLGNVHRRLKLLCGEASGISIRDSAPGGVIVRIEICPKEDK